VRQAESDGAWEDDRDPRPLVDLPDALLLERATSAVESDPGRSPRDQERRQFGLGPADLMTILGRHRDDLFRSRMLGWPMNPSGRHSPPVSTGGG
jgi:hypothetical protein